MQPFRFHISPCELAFLATLVAGLTLAMLLGFAKRLGREANLFLGLALVVVVLNTGGLTSVFLPALGPLLYFYVRQLTCPDRRFRRKDMLHFCILLAGYWMPGWLVLISVMIYLYMSHRLIRGFYNRLRPVLMDRPRFAFRRLDRVLLLLSLCCVLSMFNDFFYLTIAFVLIGMAADAMLKPDSSVQLAMPITDRSDARAKGRRLKEAVAANRLYEDAELTLTTLAVKLMIHPHDLSRIINVGLDKNFNDFINEFRVREVARKMQDPAYDRLTLTGIAYESGFNSERTFHRVFKEMTGKTPLEYKNSLRKELPIDKLAIGPRIRPVILRSGSPPNWAPEKLKRNYMFRNYLKIGIRNLWAKKAFSFINVTGLAVGMTGAILVALWVQNEYSFDSFHANNKTLYKVWYRYAANGNMEAQDITTGPLGDALKDEFPEVEKASRIYWGENRLFNYKDVALKANGNQVDKDFLTMFTFPLTEGNATHALEEVNSVVLTKHLATKIFGNADPLNQLVKLDGKQVYKVTGVMQDLPDNTEFDFEYLVPMSAFNDNSWNDNTYYTYVQLQPGADINQVNQKIKLVVQKYVAMKKHVVDKNDHVEVFLYPFSKMHLYSRFENGQVAGGKIEVIRLLLIIAGIILLTACINFMNLSTAQSHKRAMEVGVRKVMGATRINLAGQFLAESLAITFIAGITGLLLAMLALPAFNQLTTKNLHIQYANPVFWLTFLGFILLTGILAGSYPAFFLSAFRPVKVLKGRFIAVSRAFNPRKVLVVLQFAVAVVLIVSAIVVYRQVKFAQNKDIGYKSDHLVEVPIEGDIRKNFDLIKNELVSSGAAVSACRTSITVTIDGATDGGFSTNGANRDQQNITFSKFGTSGEFVKTMGLTLIGGRDLDLNVYPADSTVSCMINETAVKQLGIKDPVGSTIYQGSNPLRVVGVFKDFIINSPYVDNKPMIIFASKSWAYNSVIRLNGANGTARDLQIAEKIFKKYNPAYPFTYQFVDTEYQQKFNDQQQTGKLATIFACLTIFISCLGLFGLASYMAENRAKEIGIRKVLGASVMSITRMLAREFVILVLIAIAIAVPVAFLATNKWLQDFTYRISVGWLTFIIAGLSAVVIAVLTVSFRAIRAAMANPVKSLRSE